MTYKPGKHIYFAAGFFNDEQRSLCDFVEGLESEWTPIYSPRKDGGVLKPDSSDQVRKEVFDSNTISIATANWVLAVVDDFDAGVMWEMGYAHAKGIPTLGYTDHKDRGLNVMLAGSCNLGFIQGRDDLEAAFKMLQVGEEPFPRNTWGGRIH